MKQKIQLRGQRSCTFSLNLQPHVAPAAPFEMTQANRVSLRPPSAFNPMRLFSSVLVAAALALSGCASLPPNPARPMTTALTTPERTVLGRGVAESAPRGAASGFKLLAAGEEAYSALMRLSSEARHTLDLQYYIVREDESARAILANVREAAERGVRVRLLVDDMYTSGRDAAFVRYATHRNIEVRFFNPFPAGRSNAVTRMLASAGDIERINRRMHNKLFIADNAVAVTGGRNLGDEYFLRNEKSNFVDLDVVVAGRAVRELSAVFDRYWNNTLAYPVEVLLGPGKRVTPQEPDKEVATPKGAPKPATSEPVPLTFTWAPARVMADSPSKMIAGAVPAPSETLADDLATVLEKAREEVIVITPYLVPGEKGMALVRDLRARGVNVRILTNSLAATDAPIVHVGYARYRKDLLRAGAELYEFRPTLSKPRTTFGDFGSSRASLHAKSVVIDRRTLVVGSMNMDPRSLEKNTELGLIMASPELAAQAVKLFEEAITEASYRVELGDNGHLRWVSGAGAAREVHEDEPEAGAALRFKLWLLTPFAPESLL